MRETVKLQQLFPCVPHQVSDKHLMEKKSRKHTCACEDDEMWNWILTCYCFVAALCGEVCRAAERAGKQ